jgi:hypothetical protein
MLLLSRGQVHRRRCRQRLRRAAGLGSEGTGSDGPRAGRLPRRGSTDGEGVGGGRVRALGLSGGGRNPVLARHGSKGRAHSVRAAFGPTDRTGAALRGSGTEAVRTVSVRLIEYGNSLELPRAPSPTAALGKSRDAGCQFWATIGPPRGPPGGWRARQRPNGKRLPGKGSERRGPARELHRLQAAWV